MGTAGLKAASLRLAGAVRHAAAAGCLVVLGLPAGQASGGAQDRHGTGTIEGRVSFEGTAPPPAEVGQDGEAQPLLHVDRAGGVRDAVVYLPDARPATSPVPAAAVMNQRRHVFVPRVLAVRSGQTVRFTNDDPANHNVRAQDTDPANTFSVHTAPGSVGAATHRFAASAGRPIRLSCDIHPWMSAWVYVFSHDRFAVTGADGRFRLDAVPAGRHRVAVRLPAGRLARDLAVDVRAGQAARLDVRFGPADVGMPSR